MLFINNAILDYGQFATVIVAGNNDYVGASDACEKTLAGDRGSIVDLSPRHNATRQNDRASHSGRPERATS
jgi:hypothetical protein